MTLREHCEWAEKVSGLKIELKRKTTKNSQAQNSFFYTYLIVGNYKSPEVTNDDLLKYWLSGFVAGMKVEQENYMVDNKAGIAQSG
jgi:hypothetical protein